MFHSYRKKSPKVWAVRYVWTTETSDIIDVCPLAKQSDGKILVDGVVFSLGDWLVKLDESKWAVLKNEEFIAQYEPNQDANYWAGRADGYNDMRSKIEHFMFAYENFKRDLQEVRDGYEGGPIDYYDAVHGKKA